MATTTPVVVLTGFGPFRGVDVNPAMQLVQAFGERAGVRVLTRVVETSMQGVHEALDELDAEVDALGARDECVWVHLGVYAGAKRMRLEYRAFNEATFRCPDMQGAEPKEEPIVAADGPITRTRSTSIDVRALCECLCADLSGTPAGVTDDPGRFVCNYIYYSSLARHANALFVHIPLFDAIAEAAQMAFVQRLVDVISNYKLATLPCPPPILEALTGMGFGADKARTAWLAVDAGDGESAVEPAVSWLLEGNEADAPTNYADLLALRSSAAPALHEETKVVMVVNESLGMSAGKSAAQVGHAVLSLTRSIVHSDPGLLDRWAACGEPLIVCRAGADAFGPLQALAKSVALPCVVVHDAGRTEVAAGSLTVAAFGPGPVSQVDAVTGQLQLL